MNFNHEELMLMMLYNTGTRDALRSRSANPILYEKGFGYVFCLQEVLRMCYSEQ